MIGNDAVVPDRVAGPITPGVMPCATMACSAAGASASEVAPSGSSSVSAGTSEVRILPSFRPFLKAVTPYALLSVRAAVLLSFAVRPETFVPKPSRVTFGVPVRFRIVARLPPLTRAESVIFEPTLTM